MSFVFILAFFRDCNKFCALSKFDYSDLTRKFRFNLDDNFSNLIL
ncbi:protein of unknown function [[Clostridium] ultunense Esp]|uniref:Uncharacterized protein n=1 Tax=[Clostridium] ultunense Esp TaxID=1288971 RepID=A0A1M4PSM6_9FIRM|nr:protein of unknown function [[Clostridium] ultunense Esp]